MGNFLSAYSGKSFLFNCIKAVFCMITLFGDIQVIITIVINNIRQTVFKMRERCLLLDRYSWGGNVLFFKYC